MAKGIHEYIKQAAKAETRDEKAAILSQEKSGCLATILRIALDPSVEIDLPSGRPPFKKNELVDQEGVFYREIRKAKYLTKNTNLPQIKKQIIFIEMLENLDPNDAEVLLTAIEKKSLGKGITVNVANKAFPGLINEKK